MMIWSGVVLFFAALLAFSLSAVCGGGASFILIPLLRLVLPGAQIPAALSIGTAFSSVSRIAIFWSAIRWDIVWRFVPAAIPAVWLGAWLLSYLNPVYLELLMGLFLLSNIPLIFRKEKKNVKPSGMPLPVLSFIGFAAGFVSGLTGAVGLLFNRFYLKYGLSKEQIVATRAANELLLHLIKIGLYASFGLFTMKVLGFGLLVAIAALISSWLVKNVLPFLSESLFRKIGYSAMVVSGIFMFANASANLVVANRLGISYKPLADGSETKLQWKKSTFSLEFEYDEGFEIEYSVDKKDLSESKKAFVEEVSKGADKVFLEEVYGLNKHYYEAYVYRKGKLEKYDF